MPKQPERTLSLGGGRTVPYPVPTSEAATTIGKGNRRTDTGPELRLRRALHRLGLRYRKDPLLRIGGLRTHPDVVFPKARLAVFVDGCFWHRCPQHGTQPRANSAYWQPKLARNVERDGEVTAALEADGWTVRRIWEHVTVEEAVATVINDLDALGYGPARRLIQGGADTSKQPVSAPR